MTCRWLVAGCCPGARAGARRRATVAHDPFEMVRRFGTRVHEVDGLIEPLIYCPESDVAFVRAGLDLTERLRLARWVLTEALTERASLDAR